MNYNDMLIQITKRPITIIYGFNNTGKTTLIKQLYNDLKLSNNTIFFPSNRKFGFSKEEIDSIDTINSLNNNVNIIDFIKTRYSIEDFFALENIKKHSFITSGYLQVVNYIYTIALHEGSPDTILLIDNFELNLHPLLLNKLLIDFINIFNVKHVIVTTFDIDKYNIMFSIKDIASIKSEQTFSNNNFNIINIERLNIDY